QTFTIKLTVAPEDEDSSMGKDRLTDIALVAICDGINAMFPASVTDGRDEIPIKLLDWEFV
ncbi:MAG: hypothetical protein LBC63_08175, partial [Holophagales bacterium]|nr:hypothetical protein [Holophagales bacterium]